MVGRERVAMKKVGAIRSVCIKSQEGDMMWGWMRGTSNRGATEGNSKTRVG